MRHTVVPTVLAALMIALLAACGAQGEPAGTDTLDGEALAQERCAECHPYSRVTEASKNQEGWQQTVERMVANGARLNAEEVKAVVEYLGEAHPAQ